MTQDKPGLSSQILDSPTRAYRTDDDMIELLNRIWTSDPRTGQETNWLEWKGHLDLSTPHGKFVAAKAILAFANRSVDVAAQHCEGKSYLVIGVEPGAARGVPPIDSADLAGRIGTYAKGPRWTPQFLPFRNVTVLVITVDAPRSGDPIHTLQKTFTHEKKSSDAGTIFHRGTARSAPAGVAEVEMLSERLLAGKTLQLAEATWCDMRHLLAQLADGDVVRAVTEFGEVNDEIRSFREAQHFVDSGEAYFLEDNEVPLPSDLADKIEKMLAQRNTVRPEAIATYLQAVDSARRTWGLLDDHLRLPAVADGMRWVSERDRPKFSNCLDSLLSAVERYSTALDDESSRDPERQRTVSDIPALLRSIADSRHGSDPYLDQELGEARALVQAGSLVRDALKSLPELQQVVENRGLVTSMTG